VGKANVAPAYVFVCSLVVMENWTVCRHDFAVKTYFVTKSIVQKRKCFRREFDVMFTVV
jgi:hypothetical protein